MTTKTLERLEKIEKELREIVNETEYLSASFQSTYNVLLIVGGLIRLKEPKV